MRMPAKFPANFKKLVLSLGFDYLEIDYSGEYWGWKGKEEFHATEQVKRVLDPNRKQKTFQPMGNRSESKDAVVSQGTPNPLEEGQGEAPRRGRQRMTIFTGQKFIHGSD